MLKLKTIFTLILVHPLLAQGCLLDSDQMVDRSLEDLLLAREDRDLRRQWYPRLVEDMEEYGNLLEWSRRVNDASCTGGTRRKVVYRSDIILS